MKKGLCAFLLCGGLLCCGCDVNEMSTLPDITRPYAGEYECKTIRYGDRELIEKFEYIKLELDFYGEFEVTYAIREGGKGEYSGAYTVDEEAGEITFRAKTAGMERSYVFPYEKGSVIIEMQFAGKLLYAEFSSE